MKKIICLLLVSFTIGCSNNIKVPQIPLTSSSEEAKNLFITKVLLSNSDNQLFGPSIINDMNKIR